MFQKQFKKNKVIHLTLLLFMILAAFLMSVASCVILQTSGSMENIFSIAKPPHFLQMHTGELDEEKVQEFADSVDYVSQSEIVEMVNIDGANIWYEKKGSSAVSMAESMLDNGFVKQTKYFDYLLDLDNNIVKQEDGEIGVPISYMEKYGLSIGDTITLTKGDFSKTYEIRNFLRDSQMASTMASSVRFLMSDHDFMELKEKVGEVEYILEFRLEDSGRAGEFQKLYEDSDMPVNGQGITYPLIKLVNSLASGLLAGAMILVSIILILLAAFNLRFTILAVLEEEIHEIGAMKAIGISNKDIKKMYLKNYRVLAVIGCIIGFLIGIVTNKLFTKSIRLVLGEQALGIKGVIVSMIAVLFVYWFMMHLCKKILKRIGNITVVQSLVYGETGTRRKKSWLLIVVVFFLATNIMLVPLNLIHTVQDKKFANNMGNADCDLGMELQTKDHIEENCAQIVSMLKNDAQIESYGVFSTNKYETLGEDGEEYIQVQWGDYTEFRIPCIEGRSPEKEGEIALSYLNQVKLGKNVGDSLEITMDHQRKEYKVTGIYQDLTSGGYTAKAFSNDEFKEVQNYTIYAKCTDKSDVKKLAEQYSEMFSFAKILPIEEYTSQTFGSVIDTFADAAYVCVVVAVFIGGLITALFLKLQSAKEYSEIATLRVLGFSSKDIIKQYMIKGFLASSLGILLGILWCNTGCGDMVGFALKFADSGIADFEFVTQPIFNFVICPLILVLTAMIVTYVCAREVKDYEIIKMLQE